MGALLGGRTEYIVPPQKKAESSPDIIKEEVISVNLLVEGIRYEVSVASGSNVYDVMVQAQEDSILHFKGSEFSRLGILIEEINGIRQNSRTGEYWIYYINGRMAKIGVSGYKLQENDVISWRYQKEYE